MPIKLGQPRAPLVFTVLLTSLFVLSMFAVLPLKTSAQRNLTLSVNSIDTSSHSISGYDIVLYQNGQVIASAFTPGTFSVVSGETYSIQADSYGPCTFAFWDIPNGGGANTNYSNPLTFTATGNNGGNSMLLVPNYSCQSSPTSKLTITSQDSNGNPIYGYYTTLSGDGMMAHGFTTATYTLVSGFAYTVQVYSYRSCVFSHWLDGGSTNPSRAIEITSNEQFTVVYNCSSSANTVNIGVISTNIETSGEISGYYIALYDSNGNVIATGFTPTHFTVTKGQTYSIRADSYGSCTFNNWLDPTTSVNHYSNPYTFTATASYDQSATGPFQAEYNCS